MRNPIPLLVLLLTLLSCSVASAQQVTWDSVRQKMTDGRDYSLFCDYTGPEGQFRFHYVVLGAGAEILTEVLDGSSRGAGTKIYYNPKLDSENVTMQTSMFRLRRSLQARDIKGSPLYIPLFSQLLTEISEPLPSEVETLEQNTIFTFGDSKALHEDLVVDESGTPVALRRMEAKKQLSLLTFRDVEWGPREMDWPGTR